MPDASSSSVAVFLLVGIAVLYALGSYPLWRVAKLTRDHVDDAELAWIPIMNVILMCWMADVSPWTALVLLVGIIPGIGSLISFALFFVLWRKIGQRFGRTGLGILAGLLPIVGAWVFAFSAEAETASP